MLEFMWRQTDCRRGIGKVGEEVVRSWMFDVITTLEVVEGLLEDVEERNRWRGADGSEEWG
jgi:hypothetical protein